MRALWIVLLALAIVPPAQAAQLGGPDLQDVDPTAVAYAPDGSLLVGDADRRIARLDAGGAVVESIGLSAAPQEIAVGSGGAIAALAYGRLIVPGQPGPSVALGRTSRGLAVTADGTVLVGDPDRRAIRQFSPGGRVELAPLRLTLAPADVAVLPDGTLAVALATEFDGPGVVVILQPDGRELRRLTFAESVDVIAAAPDGALVVADDYHKITRIAPNGSRTRITTDFAPTDLSASSDGGLAAIDVEQPQYGNQYVLLRGLDAQGQPRALRAPDAPPAPGALEDPYAVGVAPGGTQVVALDAGFGLARFDAASGAPAPRLAGVNYVDQVAPLRGGGFLVSDDDIKFGRSIFLLDAQGRTRRNLGSVEEQPELAAGPDGGYVTISVPTSGSERNVVQRYGPSGHRNARFAVTGFPQLVALPRGEVATIRGPRVSVHRPHGRVRRILRLPGLRAVDAATDGRGRLFILQGTTVRRYALSDGRRLADARGDNNLRNPTALAASGDRIYVADAGNDRISVLRPPAPASP